MTKFEEALKILESTGVQPAQYYDVYTVEEAEQTAVSWLKTAVEMRKDEEDWRESQS